MVPSKVGIREFRAGLADYIASEQPVAITRHGQTVGLFIPVKTDLTAELAALRASVTAVQDELEPPGWTPRTCWRSSSRPAVRRPAECPTQPRTIPRSLILDANILVRAILGQRVLGLIDQYAGRVLFFTPDVAYAEARRHLPTIAERRGIDPQPLLAALAALEEVVTAVQAETYQVVREESLDRIRVRDPDDWPVLACALLLRQPIWTEDRDFFGTGLATWTTDRVEIYLDSED